MDHASVISAADLRTVSNARLSDAAVLLRSQRWDGAVYLCGYAVEVALKARMCQTLDWSAFPETRREFEGLQSIKTHDLEILLRLSGIEQQIKSRHLADWSVALSWNPEKRYMAGLTTPQDATNMVNATTELLSAI